ncbi:MAG: MBL fold metallo-hydrolase [Oscillospiraceae bacterium]|jgi:7,8-dihydropterin-6-yl-methyl-4-(beta-D-ribofuranosyl)aminobenzene 5'-phosphate synthase
MSKLEITVLVDNVSNNPRLHTENGLSLLVSRDGTSILFDCGDRGEFMFNAAALGEDLSNVKAVVLSHNHYDHTRGFLKWMDEVTVPYRLYVSRNFFKSSYWADESEPGLYTPTSGPLTPQVLQSNFVDWRMVSTDTYELPEFPGAYILQNIGYRTEFERPDKTDVIDSVRGLRTDTFADEQVLALSTSQGIVVITGCAHTGIANICSEVSRRFGAMPYSVIGGTHLIAADEDRIEKTVGWLKKEGIACGKFCHCTGEAGFKALLDAGYERITCGDKIVYDS